MGFRRFRLKRRKRRSAMIQPNRTQFVADSPEFTQFAIDSPAGNWLNLTIGQGIGGTFLELGHSLPGEISTASI